MMVTPIPLVVFGPTPDSYLVLYGRRFVAKNMPETLVAKIQSGELKPMTTSYISLHADGKTWIAHNFVTDTLYFDGALPPAVLDHLHGRNDHAKSTFVSFCDDAEGWFAKHARAVGWTTHFKDEYPHKIEELRRKFCDFDAGLRAIIFGKDGTHIYALGAGFVAELLGDADKPEHPLFKVLVEQGQFGTNWTLDIGSTLCFWDSRYFVLRFKKGTQINWRLSLPEHIQSVLEDLIRVSSTPEEQAALQQEQTQAEMTQKSNVTIARMARIESRNALVGA